MINKGFFRLAKNVSKYSNCRVNVGAVVVVKHKPVGVGYNINKTHPIHANPENSIRTSIHAEIRAIMNCGSADLSGGSIYVYRQTKNKQPALARPCNYCYNFIKQNGIKRIFYTTKEKPFWKLELI